MIRKKDTKRISKIVSEEESAVKKIESYSTRIADLFGKLRELPRRESIESDIAVKVSKQAAEISKEIQELLKEMNELRDRTGLWYKGNDGDHESESSQLRRLAEEEKLRLRQILGRIADAQVALVAEWNADPSEAKRQLFEREYQRLAEEYSMVRGELQLVRERIAEM